MKSVKKFLVTGGAGFIGSHLTDSLCLQGHNVTIIDDLSTGKVENVNDQAKLIVGSILDKKLMRQEIHNSDGVFHLAAIASVPASNEHWLDTHQINQSATVSILEILAESKRAGNNIPFVMASSAAIYGNPGVRVTESIAPDPLSAYAADKLGSELHAKIACNVHGLQTTCLRFFNVYGPRQDPKSPYSGVISIFSDKIVEDIEFSIHGDGMQTRDFVYVDDVVVCLCKAMQTTKEQFRVINICTGNSISIMRLVEVISKITNRAPKYSFTAAREGDVLISLGDNLTSKKALGFTPEISIEVGLKRLLSS